MSHAMDPLHHLAGLVGIAKGYRDAFNRSIETSDDSIKAILSGLGLAAGTSDDLGASIARMESLRAALVPPLLPVEAETTIRLPLQGPKSDKLRWRLQGESGWSREAETEIRVTDWENAVELPAVRAGYYDLEVECGGQTAKSLVISAPPQCFLPAAFEDGSRGYGFTAQIYGLRSSTNFGIGDFGDVARVAEGSAARGASFLGLSPVHALFASDRSKISPYSPSSRLFIDPIFIDPALAPGFAASGAAPFLNDPEIASRLDILRNQAFVDHAGAWALKREVLDLLWPAFVNGRTPAFEDFRRGCGETSSCMPRSRPFRPGSATKAAIGLVNGRRLFRTLGRDAVKTYRREAPDAITFHVWLQWLADSQLAAAHAAARKAGMQIGLYRDLAVGADRAGSEVWAHPERFAAALSVGAPPDPLGPLGQDWGLPPFNPLTLETEGLAAFRTLVAANMRHAGAIRIDHAFQLQRLFLIPNGSPAAAGAYVNYPFKALLAVLRLESHRARSLVIAEDLGNAPDGFSDAIMQAGILSYRILPFEREQDGVFKRPRAYPRNALAAMTTHDLPTFAGWWNGLDVDLRETFAIYDPATAATERKGRHREIEQFANALAEEGLVPAGTVPEEPAFEAGLRYLARTQSILSAIQLEDVVGDLNQANLPGPDVGHPNWRRKLNVDIEKILEPGGALAKIAAALATEGRDLAPAASHLAAAPPRATYRLQFHKDFTFDHAVKIVPYLARLGISHVYASPVQKARPGSTHGYDNVDPGAINPELGGSEGFARLSEAVRAEGLDLILDIVPNHMGVGGSDNKWWLSLLEWGQESPYADTFDVDWERLGASGKLVVPMLGGHYGEVLEKGDLKLAFDADEGSFSVWHYEHRFPLCPLTYADVLDRATAAEADADGRGVGALLRVAEELRGMAQEPATQHVDYVGRCETMKRRLATIAKRRDIGEAIAHAVRLFNGVPGRPERFGALHRLLERQAYRLAYWRVASSDVNYRRFFDIDTLAGTRIERPEVFDRVHAMIAGLVRKNLIQGLRIDHIDGLADPKGYAEALQSVVGPGFYIVAEKILEPGEALRPWPIAGTTGYDTLNLIDGILVDPTAEAAFDRIYRETTGFSLTYEAALHQAKSQVLQTSFASELESLVSDLKRIADSDRRTRDYTANAIRQALADIVTAFPVYRTYITHGLVDADDRALIETVVAQAKAATTLPDRSVHDFAAAALLGALPTGGPGQPTQERVAQFRRRLQQLTGPVMAKSLEDTLFYRYARFLALNEVGGEPSRFGIAPDAFHAANIARATTWPHTMIASATHDTKRGEDARARLLALSEVPDAWARALESWDELTGACTAPDKNDRYMFLQALLGAWPLELRDADDAAALTSFAERMKTYATKALREAKVHTRWIEPDTAYEDATHALIDTLLTPGAPFLATFRPFAKDLSLRGMLNGLARTILKCTLPGVPDIYQGTESWDFSLVDPDNRRPVDYAAFSQALEPERLLPKLLETWHDGAIKQALLARLLADRRLHPGFYAHAGYAPVAATGAEQASLLAFVRQHGEDGLFIAVPRLVGRAVAKAAIPLGKSFWGDTAVVLPPGRWRSVVEDEPSEHSGEVGVSALFVRLPFAVLRTIR